MYTIVACIECSKEELCIQKEETEGRVVIELTEVDVFHMRCPLCGREMTILPQARRGRISEIVYYCEEHGLLGRPSPSILLSRVSDFAPESQTSEPAEN